MRYTRISWGSNGTAAVQFNSNTSEVSSASSEGMSEHASFCNGVVPDTNSRNNIYPSVVKCCAIIMFSTWLLWQKFWNSIPLHVHSFSQQSNDMFLPRIVMCTSPTFPQRLGPQRKGPSALPFRRYPESTVIKAEELTSWENTPTVQER